MSDIPAGEALGAGWTRARRRLLDAVDVGARRRRARAGDGRAGLGAALLARLRRRRRWTASPCAPRDTLGATRDDAGAARARRFVVVDTGDPLPEGYDAVVMREHVHWRRTTAPRCARPSPPYQHVRTIGEDISATELLLPEGHRLRPVDVAAAAAAGARRVAVRRAPRGASSSRPATRSARSAPTRPGRDPRHQLPHARRAGARGGLHGRGASRSSPTTRRGSPRRCARRPARADLVVVDRRLERRAATTTRPRVVERAGDARSCTASR